MQESHLQVIGLEDTAQRAVSLKYWNKLGSAFAIYANPIS